MSRKGKLGNDLPAHRTRKGWSQKELAEMLGVSRQTIISLEASKYNPSAVLVFQIAALLEKSVTELFWYEEE